MSNYLYKKEDFINLVELAKSGDIKALEEVIKRIQKDIFSMFSYLSGNRQEIADLTQETLIKIARGISTIKDANCFHSWLNHIVANVFYDYTKKNIKDNKTDFDEDKILEIKDKAGCEPGEKCFFSEIDKVLKAALLNLPENLRIAIILREYEGLSYEDISQVTKSTLGTVKSRISRARLRLQKELKEFI